MSKEISLNIKDADGKVHRLLTNTDSTLMQVAVDNMIRGIDAECGGACSCATCHVHIVGNWMEKVGPASDTELMLLDCLGAVQENSRLACQVTLSEEMDGLEVEVAPEDF